jgi:hypothetical protein
MPDRRKGKTARLQNTMRAALKRMPKKKPEERIGKRSNGKVAQLPQTVRERINQMLVDGVRYREIIEQLGKDGKGLNRVNIGNWRKLGHQKWLKQQDRMEYMRTIREFAMEAAKENEGSVVQEAGVELAAAQIYDLLMDFEPESLKETLKGSPKNYTRIVSVLSRLSENGLKFERYRAEVALHKANIEKEIERSKQNGITVETLQRIEQEINLM